MQFRMLSCIALCGLALTGEPQEAQNETEDAPVSETTQAQPAGRQSGPCSALDPFCAKLNESIAAGKAHDALQEKLEPRIGAMTACADEIYNALTSVRKASGNAHDTYLAYLKDWRALATKDKGLFLRLTQTRSGLRGEIDRQIRELDAELNDLGRREAALNTSLREAGAPPNGKEMTALASLRSSKQERLDNLRQTTTKWEQTQRYYGASLDNAKRLETTLVEMEKLVESANDLWNVYYDSLEARAQYNCSASREPARISRSKPPV